MKMKKVIRTYSGTKETEISGRETENRRVAREAAAEGMVLLENEGVLPLKKGMKAALYGGGAVRTVKGGTGSGDVNEREVVSIYQGFLDAGIEITNQGWLDSFSMIYARERETWKNRILEEYKQGNEPNLLNVYSKHVFHMPAGKDMDAEDVEAADVVFYVVSRTAGEAADRFLSKGDYYLNDKEEEELNFLSGYGKKLVVILNTGGPIDLKFIQGLSNLKGLLSMGQPGMEAGHALADIVTGKATPSGKLTDTWAVNYEDFPNAETFSHNNGDVEKERYEEGIYVGYRYFDRFEKKPAYSFGYGKSYTEFEIKTKGIEAGNNNKITIQLQVTNIGGEWCGKEVVQIYVSAPQQKMEKEYRRLCAFAKTSLLAPGEVEELAIPIDVKSMASFYETESAWMLEKGLYGIWIGNSSKNLTLCGVIQVAEDAVIEKVAHICPLQEKIAELQPDKVKCIEMEKEWQEAAKRQGMEPISLVPIACSGQKESSPTKAWVEASKQAEELTAQLSVSEKIAMVIGEVSKGQGEALGAAGIMVPGAAGETSSVIEEKWDIPGVSMADGPAGLRLMKSYEVDTAEGTVYSQGILGALEGGIFADHTQHEGAVTYYQYCTAIPVGTVLAQTWNMELLEKVGKAVAKEMQEFQVAWWLAPGMNIHRNPLCGRNFEYYSEDPVLSGCIAAAITNGIQQIPGVGTTIKHFACNNQEDNRMGSDSILSERALREIYLRGFEIAVKRSQPMAIMTSYNLINGVHTANSKDLCTTAARDEWGFAGIIMTDWTTTNRGGSLPWKCMAAGNDLIMPGSMSDSEDIKKALEEGTLLIEELDACVRRMLTIILQTSAFENSLPYSRFLKKSEI